MYILKEQGDLVVQNPAIRNKFERNLMEKCPYECERKYWRSEVISSEVEEKVFFIFIFRLLEINGIFRLHLCLEQTRKIYQLLNLIIAITNLLQLCSLNPDSLFLLTD